MSWLQDLPVKRKLTLVILLTCSTALLLACGVLAVYEWFDFRQAMVRDTTILADVLGKNTRAALAFQDEVTAQETLAALQVEPDVTVACVYSRDGSRFAEYLRAGTSPDLSATPASNGHRFEAGHLALFRPILLNEKRIGTIYLQTDLRGMHARLRLFGGIAMLVLFCSLLSAFFLSSKLQKQISEPILALAETAKTVSGQRDYSIRARKFSEDELGLLTDAFNQMLSQIQEQTRSLRDSENQLHTIVESLSEGVAVSSLEGQLLHFNRAALELHGFATLDECRRRLPEFASTFELSTLDGTVLPLDRWPLALILQGEKLHEWDVRIRNLHAGWVKTFSYGGTLVHDAGGKPMMAVVTIRDVTERKQTETRLRIQLSQLDLLNRITRATGERLDLQSIFQVVIRNLEDNLPVDFACVCLYDPTDNSVTVTRVGVRSEALAMELAMTEQARIPSDQNGLSRCVRGQLVYEPDLSQVKSPFPERLVRGGLRSLVAAPLLVESKVFGLILVARHQPQAFNSTECEFLRQLSEHVALAAHQAQLYNALQQAYDDLRQTQQAVMQQERLRALGQMASGIAHDINNAISPVALYTESLLETDSSLSPKARKYLEVIGRSIGDVAHTVTRMREFYRQREVQMTLTPVRLNDLVKQVTDLTRARWNDMPQQRGIVIQMKTELSQNLPEIMGVESEIREALTNLVFNAVDAMPDGGTLTLRTRMKNENTGKDEAPLQAQVEVSDTGVGMDEDTRRRCLEPFYTTKGERGTGLGLAMVYGIVQRHSADLEIESALRLGSTFRLSFAAALPNIAAPIHSNKPYLVPSPLHILLVDDDPLLLKSLRDILETDGHTILSANGGQEGIDAFHMAQQKQTRLNVVITDLGMPYVDGRKVAASVKMASPSTPVILLTGWGQRLIAEGDIPPHVDLVLSKPPKLRELREALVQFTQQKKT